jgi:hypothetical protein
MNSQDGPQASEHHGMLVAVDDAIDYLAGQRKAAEGSPQTVAWDTEPDPRFIPGVQEFTWTAASPEVIREWFARFLVRLEDLIETGKWKHRSLWSAPDEKILTVTGQCPRCLHPMSDREGLAQGEECPPIIIACNCLGDHAGRPETLPRGCGQAAFFKHPSDDREKVQVAAQNRAVRERDRYLADPDDLVWESQRQNARMESLKRTQEIAEKWTTTISALTGLFTLAGIITGTEAIARVRSEWWFWIVPFCFAFAFITALLSIYLGALAAQGVPHAPNMDGHRYRLVSVADALKAGVQLKWSRRTVVAAALALGLGVGMMLYGPASSTPISYVKMEMVDGSVLCTDLQTLPGGNLAPLATLSGVLNVTLVNDCKPTTAAAPLPAE